MFTFWQTDAKSRFKYYSTVSGYRVLSKEPLAQCDSQIWVCTAKQRNQPSVPRKRWGGYQKWVFLHIQSVPRASNLMPELPPSCIFHELLLCYLQLATTHLQVLLLCPKVHFIDRFIICPHRDGTKSVAVLWSEHGKVQKGFGGTPFKMHIFHSFLHNRYMAIWGHMGPGLGCMNWVSW